MKIYFLQITLLLLKTVKEITPNIMILVMLPDGDGFDFMKEIRKSSDISVIFLTAKDEEIKTKLLVLVQVQIIT